MILVPLLAVSALLTSGDPITSVYTGSFRAKAKTTMLSRRIQPYNSVSQLKQALFVNDDTMRQKYGSFRGLDRQKEERHVVTFQGNLIAVTFEDHSKSASADNDFHLIIGDSSGNLVNAEASGLPPAGDPAGKFASVRSELIDILHNNNIPVKNKFVMVDPPILVKITGSIYFDADHGAGAVGPEGSRPDMVWEIHPIHHIRQVGASATRGAGILPVF